MISRSHRSISFRGWSAIGAWLGAVAVALALAGCGGPRTAGPDDETAPRAVTVVSVHDGDTVRVREGSGRVRTVRLATIDAPELEQPFGVQSRDAVRERVQGRVMTLEPRGRDRYGRALGVLWLPGEADPQDLALWAVGQGLAWHYGAHAREQPLTERWRYTVAEALARGSRLGLWAQPDPQPPWAWRRERRGTSPTSIPGDSPSTRVPEPAGN